MSIGTRDFILLIVAVVVGTGSGISVIRLAGSSGAETPLPEEDRAAGVQLAADRLEGLISRLDARLDLLEEARAGFERSLADAAQEASPGVQASREPANAKEAVDWAAALDQGLSRLLLERGLTPFDAGVSGPLTIAGRKLREALGSQDEGLRALQRDQDQGVIDGVQKNEKVALVFARQRETRGAALAELEKALDRLAEED